MSKYSSKDLDFSVGGESMKAHILDDLTLAVEVGSEEATAFGESAVTHVSTGIKRGEPITVGGYYDDTATTGPDAVFNTLGTTVAIVITWGGAKTSSFNAIVKKYDRFAKIGVMTRYVATLLPTGAITEA